jgi:hypothetical protein
VQSLNRHLFTIAVVLSLSTLSLAQTPTPEHPTGWRGDGTGKYPNAHPVFTWSRAVKTPIAAMTTLADRPPKDGSAAGSAMTRTRGAFEPTEWLVLGKIDPTHSGWAKKGYPVLIVIDPKEKKAIYHQRLDMQPEIHYGPDGPGVAASLALAGGKFFVMDDRGTTIVFDPGREFKMAAKNVIEDMTRGGHQEITESTPIFDGDKIYIRGEDNLYCVGETK